MLLALYSIFTSNATSGDYTGIYLADGTKFKYELGDFFHCQCCSYITITKMQDVKCANTHNKSGRGVSHCKGIFIRLSNSECRTKTHIAETIELEEL